ncbi:YajQ family cyclic di-GMP-binding protein [Salipaludibacillus sp. CUR1]|uniref:YajQ family cyclic di-GMP-binding protein n=1 Tax=Salipaludibacillus sp. CUR1 TaxID=2820003 RepID=UPI001E46731B|nr:YajQ family cyclic di-GMP-binding protein [Salipaludibacillus sp. CUR1]MCE7791563.1 YajQ family cyclic di-GMP-binding protein [Salipaludibacillus sp. CUR1]
MAKESSFDIVSKVDFSKVQNAVVMATKEIQNRYDFKGSKSKLTLEDEELVLVSDDEFKMDQLKDVLVSKLIKQDVSLKSLDYGKLEPASGGTVRQRAKLIQGIDKDNAKKITKLVKDNGLKVKTQIQDDQVRVSGKNRDDLQKVIAAIKEADLSLPLQFINYR